MNNHSRFPLSLLCLAAAVLLLFCSPAPSLAKPYTGKGLKAGYLRCEYRIDPLGIDETAPRLSWVVQSGERGQRQSAYRLLVASTPALLKHDQGDLWDSGKLDTDNTIGAAYQGKALSSGERCFWKVKVWDKDGRESAWSKPACWTMGLLQPGDWHARWIGYDKPHQETLTEAPLGGAQWIWDAAVPAGKAPKGRRLLVHRFALSPGTKVSHAVLYATADDAMQFSLNGHVRLITQPAHEGWRVAQHIDVANALRPGPNELRVLVENAEESPAGLISRLVITTDKGQNEVQVTDGSWKCLANPGDDWLKAPLDYAALPAVRVVADYGAEPWGRIKFSKTFLPPPSYLRTQFSVDKPLAHATLYATALGLVDMHLNGQRVSDDFFTPGWTDYKKRVCYRTYDVTHLLHRGANALGAVLADGWFSGYIGYRGDRDHYGKRPRLRAQLHLEYADGSSADIGTGPDWKATTGPEREADFLQGETYDARLERPDWCQPGCDLSGWEPVVVGSDEVHPLVQAHPGEPVRAIHEFQTQSITEPKPGVYVLNLGQNFAGVARLKLSGKPGQRITLRFAERLNPDGTVYTTNLRSARATDTYICKGQGTETWRPRFTFHGFQYVELSGLDKKPGRDTITGVALSSDTPVVGEFQCSDPMLNKIHSNGYWTQRANFIDVPTDCPQRDERMGWTGDAQVYIRTATLNTDVQAFFKKWLVDLDTDSQRADGQFPCVAPLVVAGDDGGPAWADAGVVCPWTIYSVYGDTRVLERHYEQMKRFVEFCRARSTPDLLPPANFHCFGDWLSIHADTPKEVIYEAYFAHSTKLLANAAKVLGKTDEADQYNALFRKIRAAFNKAYVEPDGQIKGHTQTDYALAIDFGLVTGKRRRQARQHLLAEIASRDYHLSTGFIGTKYLMLSLSEVGRPDIAYRLLHNDSFPSWGFSIKNGATSIWERWDGWTPDKGFQDPGMNSFAHYSFGAVYQWMFENIGGITATKAFQDLTIAPKLDPKLTAATVSYHSIHGLIVSDWRQEQGKFQLNVTIPANTTATVVLPAQAMEDITESHHPLAKAQGVSFLKLQKGKAYLSVGSGQYEFAVAAH